MELFGSIKKLIEKTKNDEIVPSLEVVQVVLLQCKLVDNQYQQKSEVKNLIFCSVNCITKQFSVFGNL